MLFPAPNSRGLCRDGVFWGDSPVSPLAVRGLLHCAMQRQGRVQTFQPRDSVGMRQAAGVCFAPGGGGGPLPRRRAWPLSRPAQAAASPPADTPAHLALEKTIAFGCPRHLKDKCVARGAAVHYFVLQSACRWV